MLKLILNFDINKTLIAIDPVNKKEVDEVIQGALASKMKAKWDDQIETPITYENYLIMKGISKQERRNYIVNFLEYLKEHSHLYNSALSMYNRAMDVYRNMKTENKEIFTSFYELISYLDNNENIQYRIVFRTFGEDLPKIIEELENILDWKVSVAKFNSGSLIVSETKDLCDHTKFLTSREHDFVYKLEHKLKMYEFIRDSEHHLAILDDYKEWAKNDEAQEHGKLHLIDESDENTLSIFFDDNITKDPSSRTNIVSCYDAVHGKNMSIDKAVERGYVYKVDTIKALSDPKYFINLVSKTISQNKQTKQ